MTAAMDFKEATLPYHQLCLSILFIHALAVVLLYFLCRFFGDLFIDVLVAFHLLMDAVFLANVDSYLQVDNSSEPDKKSMSKHARNGSLKPLNETPPIKPIINNSISTSLLRPKEKKVSLTQKKLRFSLNFEIGETPNRQFNDSTTSEIFSSEHADESDLFLPLDTSNSESQNPDYLPFADDEIEDPKQPIDDDTGVHSIDDDDNIESISDEESNPNSELHLDGIDDCEMGSDDSPRRTDPKREPTPPSEDDFDEFLTMLRQDSLQHAS